jgi:hypothetical protein
MPGRGTERTWVCALRLLGALWLLLSGLAAPAAGAATPGPVTVRSGEHRGFGRLVFDFPLRVGWRMSRHGDVVRLDFGRALPFGPDPALPRNVKALTDAPGFAEVTVAPGARLRRMRVGARLVLDVLDPARPTTPAPRSAPVVSRREGPAPPAPTALVASRGTRGPSAAAQDTDPSGAAPAHPTAGAKPAVAPTTADTKPAQPAAAASASRAATPASTTGATASGEPAVAASRLAASPPAVAQQDLSAAAGPSQAAPSAPATRAAAALPVVGAAPQPTGPVALAALPAPGPAGAHASAMLVPFEASVGAAAFTRAGQGVVVFDTPRPIDLAALRGNPVFGSASVHLLPAGTVLRLPMPPGVYLALRRRAAGWEVSVGPVGAPGPVIRPSVTGGEVRLEAPRPGHVVSLLDPASGAPLLVGTELGRGAGLAVIRRAPQFELLPSVQGVVAEALSDRLALRAVADGFLLSEVGGPLTLTPASRMTAALAAAASLTRRFRFPALPMAALRRRLQAELAAAARRPPLVRGPLLRRAARSMIALGMGAEAGALLDLAAADDPSEALSPVHAGLAAVAALLAGHPNRAGGIDAPSLSGSDEVSLWRAVRAAELVPGSPRAAQLFAATAPLILTYPRALRRRLLPLAAETMAAGGEPASAARLLDSRPHDPRLAFARGMLAAVRGRTAAALAIYDRLAEGADRLVRIRAATRAVALRLATKQIGPAQAADALDRLLDAWRGGKRELALRERLAALRAEAGQWQRALHTLRRTVADFPAARERLRRRMRGIFAAMLKDPRFDKASPLRFVSLLDANADLLPKGRAGEAIAAKLADRLLALDLPDQAAPVLEKLMRAAPTGAARASFGARLATLRLAGKDPAGALAALHGSAAEDLPAALADRRAVLAAQVQAAEGQVAQAVEALRALGTATADRAAARIAERAGDWVGAEDALRAYVARALPASGALDPPQRQLLLRLATATVRAGDAPGLTTLRGEQGRMGTGPLADMFRLLTGPSVRGLADLPRVGIEAALAGRLGDTLKAVR